MLDVNLSCVLLLAHFSAAHLLCTNLDMASVAPNRALLEPWEVRFFFKTASSSSTTFPTANCKQTVKTSKDAFL